MIGKRIRFLGGCPDVVYRRVLGWSNYAAGNDGSVWGLYHRSKGGYVKTRPVRLKAHIKTSGYLGVILSRIGSKPKNFRVHQIIALAFIGPVPDGKQVDHVDGNKRNNRPENLRYVTPQENSIAKFEQGTANIGVKNGRAKLTESDVRMIRSRHAELGTAFFVRKHEVTKETIYHILKRIIWKSVK